MPLGIGEYPPEFNPKIHGPYNPANYYGKADTHLSQVKVGELGAWLGRRSFHPLSIGRAITRGYWRWAQKWMLCKKPGFVPFAQVAMAICVFNYVDSFGATKYHRHVKYHY